jgi:hypothetical protein
MEATARQSGSVDMLGPVCSVTACTRIKPEGLNEVKRPLRPGHCYVLPRKEVIQPQLPLRLPCSCGSPCRHGAWTISSSWLPRDPNGAINRLYFPWVPLIVCCSEQIAPST